MDAATEVIVLDDSSDASSESEMLQTSASTTPPMSPVLQRRRAQSVGYANAVEAALAMAAALETQGPSTSRISSKKKETKVVPAPPLLSSKSRKQHAKQLSDRRMLQPGGARSKENDRRSQKSVFRRRDREKHRSSHPRVSASSLSSSCSSDSSSSSGSETRRRRHVDVAATDRQVLRRPSSSTTQKTGSTHRRRSPSGANKRQQLQGRRRSSAGAQPPAKNKQPVEVVDLLSSSSSSSSDSSVVHHPRSLSVSSVSSLTSSDSESLTRSPVTTGKKRLVLNDRVLGHSKPRPGSLSGKHAEGPETAGRPQSSTHASSQAMSKALAAVRAGKRKRALPQMRRESNSVKKRGRVPGDPLIKKRLKRKKKSVESSVGARDSRTKSAAATQNDPMPLSSSLPSSSASSSPASSPRPVPSRKTTSSSQSASRAREGEKDAFKRYHCRKSVTASSNTPTSASAVPAASPPLLSSLTSPSPRKKRQVLSYFNTDHMALDDLQAQERELAWIQSQHKRTKIRSCPSKPAAPKRKLSREAIYVDDYSNANSAACSEEVARQQDEGKAKLKSSAADRASPVVCHNEILLHPTSYRGVFFDEAPPNILSVSGQVCSVPFASDCDHPLTFYDETDTLASHCAILESFGKPTQYISSVFPSEVVKPQSDVTRSVSSLVTAHLPIIRRCHQRKVQAVLSEARQKISAYQAALKKHRTVRGDHSEVTSHVLPRSSAEKHAVKQLKAAQHTCSLGVGSVSFLIGRGDSFVREKTVSSLIQINRIEQIRVLRKYTTSIGLRANYRVDDDPILRYTASTRPSGADGGNGIGESAKNYGLRVGNVADEEVAEYVLRLVVGRLGDSEQVFHALKSELDFSQAYTAYSELKKLHDSRQRANVRLDHVEKLGRNGEHAGVAAIINLMEQSTLSKASRTRALTQRLQPPICNFESSIVDSLVDSLVDSASTGMAALGLRTTDNYNELVDVYGSSFCRMCYRYACHEHGGDHPLPARRVDPAYRLAPSASLIAARTGDEARVVALASSEEEDVVYLSDGENYVEMCDGGSAQQQRKGGKAMLDPSEYVDASHVPVVAAKMRSFLSTSSVCGKLCWKGGDLTEGSPRRAAISSAELGVLRKLRSTMGDNSCLLAAVVGSASCVDVHKWIEKEKINGDHGSADGIGRSGRRVRSWKHGRRSGGSNHELVQRTRNQRLQDRGTENHEYQPCTHEGMCDSNGCSCMKRDHMCEKACACSRDCPNRFEGCSCAPGECRTSKCSCFAALRECDPDVCVSCGASELAVAVVCNTGMSGRSTCCNVNVIRSKHKRLGMSFSSIHGYGMFARELIAAAEFVYEYTGAMLSQDEAERRGLIYDEMEMSYLFDLNEDAVLDALRNGNKSKFINHDGEMPNCTAKVVSVCGVHHITIWALREIRVGEELVFDYGYKRSVGPDWSQRRAASSDTK